MSEEMNRRMRAAAGRTQVGTKEEKPPEEIDRKALAERLDGLAVTVEAALKEVAALRAAIAPDEGEEEE